MLVQSNRKGTRTTFPDGVRSANLLDSATITGPNQTWVEDITFIATDGGYRYLALVTDLASRKIVSITRPPCQAIRDNFTSTTAGKFRAAYLPPKAGRVNAWLGFTLLK